MAEYKIILMNANGPSQKGNAKKRKTVIRDVLQDDAPSLIFTQEFGWVALHSPATAWKGMNIPRNYQHYGHKIAGFIFNEDTISMPRVDRTSEDFVRSRMFVKTLTFEPNLDILCVSYHGPNNSVKNKKRIEYITILFDILLRDTIYNGNLPILIGGDFNLAASEVRRILPGGLSLHPPSEDSIDMFIISNDLNVVSMEKMTQRSGFDHCHVQLILTISSGHQQRTTSAGQEAVMDSATVAELKKENEELKAQLRQAEDDHLQKSELKKENKELKTQLRQAEDDHLQKSELKKENEELKTQLRQAEDDHLQKSELKKENKELKTQLRQAEDDHLQKSEIKKENKELKAQLRQEKDDHAELKDNHRHLLKLAYQSFDMTEQSIAMTGHNIVQSYQLRDIHRYPLGPQSW